MDKTANTILLTFNHVTRKWDDRSTNEPYESLNKHAMDHTPITCERCGHQHNFGMRRLTDEAVICDDCIDLEILPADQY